MARIICDNQFCEVPVMGFKLKLKRWTKQSSAPDKESNKTLVVKREVGECPAGGKTDRTLVIEIPTVNELGTAAKLLADQTPDDHMSLSPFACSVQGQKVQVKYYLQVVVVHDTGKGAISTMPITVQRDFTQPHVLTINNLQVPLNWNPIMHPPIQMHPPVAPMANTQQRAM